MSRPDFIKHFSEIQERDGESNHYPDSDELLSVGSAFGRSFNLSRLGIHHELLPPGRRTSWPHSHSADEEFVYVIEGTPDVWVDGELYRLRPGDGVGFPPGTGMSHTVINNTKRDVRLLVVGDARRSGDLGFYPLNPEGNDRLKAKNRYWESSPQRKLGPHNGLPDKPDRAAQPRDDFTRYAILLKKTPGAEQNEALIRRHVQYLRELDRRGALVLCGPFLDADGGLVVVKAASIEEAKGLALADPFVKEGARNFEVRTWKLSCEENNHLGMG